MLWNAIFKLASPVFNLSLLFPNHPLPSPSKNKHTKKTNKTKEKIATDRTNQWRKHVGHTLIISETNYLRRRNEPKIVSSKRRTDSGTHGPPVLELLSKSEHAYIPPNS